MAWPGKLFCKISDFRWIINIYLNTILVYTFSKNKCDIYIHICIFYCSKKITWSWLSTNLHVYSTALLTLCKLLYSRALKLFHLSCLKFYVYWPATLISPSLGPLATTILLSYAMSVTTLDISYKWNHAVFVFLWLAYFA